MTINTAFNLVLDLFGFSQNVKEPTHWSLELVLTCAIETEYLIEFLENPILSDNFLISFKFALMDYTAMGKTFYYSRCLFAVTKCNNIISLLLLSSIQCANTVTELC